MFISIGIFLILVLLSYQDWRERKVVWLWFIPLIALIFIDHFNEVNLQEQVVTITLNLTYLSLQMVLIWLYFYVKTKERKNIINTYFGLGDLFLLVVFSFAFSLMNYVVFLMTGMLFSIFLHLILQPIFKLKNNSVPLVTYFSIFFILLWSLEKTGIITSFYGNWIAFLMK